MAYDTPDITSLLTLEPHGPDTFVGTGPEYPWGKRVSTRTRPMSRSAACPTWTGPRRVRDDDSWGTTWRPRASEGIRGGRGMSHGRVLTTDGVHVATVTQEVLIRDLRPDA